MPLLRRNISSHKLNKLKNPIANKSSETNNNNNDDNASSNEDFGSKATVTDTTKPRGRSLLTTLAASSSSSSLRSRSRSISVDSTRSSSSTNNNNTSLLVAVTSCRSSSYSSNSTSKSNSSIYTLPKKSPANLKLFQELARGVKDAYEAVGIRFAKNNNRETVQQSDGDKILVEFMANLDFLLALVDEVAHDTLTHKTLRHDVTFKAMRDVIKKGSKLLEETMLVRREEKYNLFFRIVGKDDVNELQMLKKWSGKVELAVGKVSTQEDLGDESSSNDAIIEHIKSSSSNSTKKALHRQQQDHYVASKKTLMQRGRSLLPTAGKVRARRATPTPKRRFRRQHGGSEPEDAAEDGFATSTVSNHMDMENSSTHSSISEFQHVLEDSNNETTPLTSPAPQALLLNTVSVISNNSIRDESLSTAESSVEDDGKLELKEVIKSLQIEKIQGNCGIDEEDNDGQGGIPVSDNVSLLSDEVPSLPGDYIHRHRVMQQVVNSLLDKNGAGPRDVDEEDVQTAIYTVLTSRHADKPGNGKSTVALATLNTVEVRQYFKDGIVWLSLDRLASLHGTSSQGGGSSSTSVSLSDSAVRRGYESLLDQLGYFEDNDSKSSDEMEALNNLSPANVEKKKLPKVTRQYLYCGDLYAIKSHLSTILSPKKILLVLDGVQSSLDASRFMFQSIDEQVNDTNIRILVTTRQMALLPSSISNEILVRILSESEAVKLFLASAGRKAFDRTGSLWEEAKSIVKGCGNGPVALKVAGGTLAYTSLRESSKPWDFRLYPQKRNNGDDEPLQNGAGHCGELSFSDLITNSFSKRSKYVRWTSKSQSWMKLKELCQSNLDEAAQIRSFSRVLAHVIDYAFSSIDDTKERNLLRLCFVCFGVVFANIDDAIPEGIVAELFSFLSGENDETLNENESDDTDFHVGGDAESLTSSSIAQRVLLALTCLNLLESIKNSEDGHRYYKMQPSIKNIAGLMSQRTTPSFAPGKEVLYEAPINKREPVASKTKRYSNDPYVNQIFTHIKRRKAGVAMSQLYELLLESILGESWKGNIRECIQKLFPLDPAIENHILRHLPYYAIMSKSYYAASMLLSEIVFIRRRFEHLGSMEATRLQSAQALLLFSKHHHVGKSSASVANDDYEVSNRMDSILNNAVTEVYRNELSRSSLNIARCVTLIGDGLFKSREYVSSIFRFEEACCLYRNELGADHIDLAISLENVAKACVKVNEERLAILRYEEAYRIYEVNGMTQHANAISNRTHTAELLVSSGYFAEAENVYKDVIQKIKSNNDVNNNHDTSRAIGQIYSDWGSHLVKSGKYNESMEKYELSKKTYNNAISLLSLSEGSASNSAIGLLCDSALVTLSIASVKSRQKDLKGSIEVYETGVAELREVLKLPENSGEQLPKYIVNALNKIGSMRSKLGQVDDALDAYERLINEVRGDAATSPFLSDVAKSHIKCATIREARMDHEKAIYHLREALKLYTVKQGVDHKDTLAIASSIQQLQDHLQAEHVEEKTDSAAEVRQQHSM